MPVLRSRLDPAAADTRANHEAMAVLVDDLRRRQSDLADRGDLQAAGGEEPEGVLAAGRLEIGRDRFSEIGRAHV